MYAFKVKIGEIYYYVLNAFEYFFIVIWELGEIETINKVMASKGQREGK
jgi:hypothetical protein